MKNIGDFTILDEPAIYDNKRHCTLLKCRCKCGKELYVNKYTLDNGKSIRCRSCFGKTLIGEKNSNFKGYKNIPRRIITRSKRRAKEAKIPWNIDIKFLNSLYVKQKEKCPMTGLPISFVDKTASLDRIKSSEGYTNGNVWWVHKDANVMKNGFELEYFTFFCKRVSENLKDTIEKSKFVYGKH